MILFSTWQVFWLWKKHQRADTGERKRASEMCDFGCWGRKIYCTKKLTFEISNNQIGEVNEGFNHTGNTYLLWRIRSWGSSGIFLWQEPRKLRSHSRDAQKWQFPHLWKRLRVGSSKRSWILGDWWAYHGALLCAEILPTNWGKENTSLDLFPFTIA